MSRRALTTAARVVATLAFVGLAVALVDFRDRWIVGGDVRREAPPEGTSDVRYEPGFLTLLGGVSAPRLAGLAALFVVPIFLLALRWWVLLRANGISAPLGRAFRITYAGLFFNNFLPGSVGGDIARAVIAAGGEPRKGAVVGTVLLDRVIGLIAMTLMALAAVLPFASHPAMRVPLALVLGLAGSMAAGYVVYFNRVLRGSRLGRWLRSKVPASGLDLDDALQTLRRHPAAVAATLALSLAAQAGSIVLIFAIARVLGIGQPTLAQFFVFEPIIFVATAVPVSVGGWGVQESVYAALFGIAGVRANAAVALSLTVRLCQIAASLPGALIFGLGWTRRPAIHP